MRRPFNRKEYFYSFIRNKIQVPICSPLGWQHARQAGRQAARRRTILSVWLTCMAQTVRYRSGKRHVPNQAQREEGFRELRTAIKARCRTAARRHLCQATP